MRRRGLVAAVSTAIAVTATVAVAVRSDDGGGDPASKGIDIGAPIDLRWMVLGDSYSSGEGVPPLPHDTGCARSAHGWGHLVDRHLRSELGYRTEFRLIACTGATVPDLSRPRPGEPSQLDALRAARPDLVALTIGGNDLGFVRHFVACGLLHDCVVKAPVIDSPETAMAALEPRLVALYREIQAVLPSPDRLVVIAYPHVTASAADFSAASPACVLLTAASSDSMHRASDLVATFLRRVADEVGATFVDATRTALDGHEVCAGPARNWWINGVSLEVGFPPTLGVRPESLHPNGPGQVALAAAVAPAIAEVLGDTG